MEKIDYAIVIRTLGKAREKYKRLLNSIENLNPCPKEVIVVLPEGYDLPVERLGYEKFVFCKKGMVTQRIEGIYHTKCEYILFCDDDISFSSDYIMKLYEPMKDGLADVTIGPLLEFFPQKGGMSIASALLGGAIPTIFNKNNYTTILRSSGWSYNRIDLNNCNKYYKVQSAAWTNFFIKRQVMIDIDFDSELWLEKSGYAYLDDQTMFYKLYKMGYRTLLVSDATYIHEDARTSTRELKLEPIYAFGFNHYIFWHRFIYSLHTNKFDKLIDIIAFNYWYIMNILYNTVRNYKNKEVVNKLREGVKDGKKYVKTKSYKSLPLIQSKYEIDRQIKLKKIICNNEFELK